MCILQRDREINTQGHRKREREGKKAMKIWHVCGGLRKTWKNSVDFGRIEIKLLGWVANPFISYLSSSKPTSLKKLLALVIPSDGLHNNIFIQLHHILWPHSFSRYMLSFSFCLILITTLFIKTNMPQC